MIDVSDPPITEEPHIPLSPPPTEPAAPKLQVEHWAERKGMLPELFPAAPARAGTFPVAPRYNHKFSGFSAARALLQWPIGAEVTEAEFDAAVLAATTGVSR